MNKKLKKNQTQTKLLFANSYVGFEITKYLKKKVHINKTRK